VPIKRASPVVRYRPEVGRVQAFVAHPPAVFPDFEVLADEALAPSGEREQTESCRVCRARGSA
jgi:hypothetical protein